jgi:hypothetical protein
MRRHLEAPDGDASFTERDDCLYDLYAVCNHIGDLHSGHYTGECLHAFFLRFQLLLLRVFIFLARKSHAEKCFRKNIRTPSQGG